MSSASELSRVTIVRSRYGGFYEPGEWIAFPLWPEELPDAWNGNDRDCEESFRLHRHEVGGGPTPQDAYDDLLRRLSQR